MAHANAELARRLMEAIEAGDAQTAMGFYTDDVVFHLPAAGRLTGTFKGKAEIGTILRTMDEVTGGTMRREVHDIAATDDHAVILVKASAQRDGKAYSWNGVAVCDIRGGKIVEQWVVSADPDVTNEALR